MNLNQSIRSAIVRSVIADIPRKYTNEEIQKKLQQIMEEDLFKYAPKAVIAAYKDKEAKNWLSWTSSNAGYLATGKSYWCGMPQIQRLSDFDPSDSAREKITEYLKLAETELDEINAIRTSLASAIEGIRTSKQFLLRFPELEKYLPREDGRTSNLPAIANVVAGLVKLGWPKDATQPEPVAA